ncbi:DeoR/GlpR transcriptional regulator [Rothia amarae]|uniref:DeoR/GlpR transcriptional regulator n=1 Tax=Rothia amarae TaxID=169480 RepID=A0A7H2BJM3_9MICC|nr:DeoR/GlpR transcriptional regulator [Rothia amarae]QNV39869.1 DeoR/GlpR transcriptional regulator [Rothia amarae]
MLADERHSLIITEVDQRGGPYPPQSSLKDLSELAERGLIVKVHGDARSVHSTNNPTFDTKFSTNRTAKEALARVAAEFIHDGASLAFSAVTTRRW